MKKRIVSIELLRILSMMMVVMLHYLGKGGLLPQATDSMSLNGCLAWGMESLSIVAVNVYMIISGYFLVESAFKPSRAAELVCQVLFYSVLVPVVLMALGVLSPGEVTINRILENILPVQMNHYWFITAYLIMYLLQPVLSTAAKTLKKEQLRSTILALLFFFSVSKSVLPVELAVDRKGYDALWFICVFLVAAYMRLYGLPFFAEKGSVRRGICCYLAGCAGIYGIMLAVRAVYLRTGSLDHFIGSTYHYNHVLNLFAAVALFYAFYHMKINENGRFARLICRVAPHTLGVYLLHEQIDIRYLWPKWMGATAEGSAVLFVIRSILTVLVVFAAGTLADMIRTKIFKTFKVFVGHRRLK